jgi:F-type H+-transporting ATPase subunit delta
VNTSIIARNYADTLLELARREGGEEIVDRYAEALSEVTGVIADEPRVRRFLESPRIDGDAKKDALRASFAGRVPERFLRFLYIVVDKRRESLMEAIGDAYQALVDEARGRVRAEVALPQEPDEAMRQSVVRALEQRSGRTVVARFVVDPALLGGVRIRIGDEILDGSIRRQMARMRRRLLEADLPPAQVATS